MDIFSFLFKQLKTTNIFVLADLIKIFLESQFLSFISYLIKGIDFKYFIKAYVEELVGLKKMHSFKFFVNNNE
jgi:hypothetical protein